MSTLSEYLKQRGLNLDPKPLGEALNLISEEDLTKICDLSEEALILLIQPRLDVIGKELLHDAIPEEVVVLRQAIVEIGGLIDDKRAYAKEMERRKTIKETNPETQPQTSPPVEVGKEGAL